MEWVTLGIAVVALGLSAFNTLVSFKRGGRAEQRAERAEARERQARLAVTPGPVSGGSTASLVHWEYMVRNTSDATAWDIRVWHADSETGEAYSTVAGGEDARLAAGEIFAMGVDGPPRPGNRTTIKVGWRDADGPHEAEAGTARPHA